MTRTDALRWGVGIRSRVVVPPEVQALVTERQGGKYCCDCQRLGLTPPPDEPLELDHIQALHRGGDNHHLNLRWLCKSHNAGKGARKAKLTQPRWARRGPKRG